MRFRIFTYLIITLFSFSLSSSIINAKKIEGKGKPPWAGQGNKGKKHMSVSIVGNETPVVVTGAGTINIPVPTSTQIGDHHLIIVAGRTTAGGLPDWTVPTGTGWSYDVVGDIGGLTVIEETYTVTPPSSVTINFSTNDVHAVVGSITLRGAEFHLGHSWFRVAETYYNSGAPHPYTISDFATEYDETFILTSYLTQGASPTLPAEQNQLINYAYSGPPSVDLSIGHQTVALHSHVGEQQLNYSGNIIALIQIQFTPAGGASSIYLNHWSIADGPWNYFSTSPPEIIFDNNGPYVYTIGYSQIESGWTTIRKINRNTFAVEATLDTTDLDQYLTEYGNACDQDDNYLYFITRWQFFGNQSPSIVKVAKSNLSIVFKGDTPFNMDFSSDLKIGKEGTWSDGLIFSVIGKAFDSNYYLVGWNTNDGSVAVNTIIPGAPFQLENQGNQFGRWAHLAIDDQGDVYVLGGDNNTTVDFQYNVIIPKMVSGEFTLTYLYNPNLWMNDDLDNAGMFYDDLSDSLYIYTSSTEIDKGYRSKIARYSIAGGGWVYEKNYQGYLLSDNQSMSHHGNGIRSLFGVPSLFVSWIAEGEWDLGFGLAPGSIVQYNAYTGEVVRTITLPDNYLYVANPVLSPEGKLWMIALDADTFEESLLVLDVTTALDEAGEGSDPNPNGGGGQAEIRITQQAVEVLNDLPPQILVERTDDDGGLEFLSGIRLRVGGNPDAEQWLKLRNKKLIYLVTLTIKYVSSGTIQTENIYLSNHAFNTKPTEDPPNTEFIAVLRDEDIPSLKQELSEVLYGLSIPTVGKIVISNADGQFDGKLPISGYVWDGGNVDIKLTGDRADLDFGNAIQIFKGKIGKVEFADNAITVEIMSRAAELQKKKVPNTSFIGVNDEDIPSPVAYGYVNNLTPYLKDEVNFTYKICGHTINDITAVYDNGVALSSVQYTKDLTNGEFTLVAVPAGIITCDVEGKLINGDFSPYRADFIYDLLSSYGGLTNDEIDLSSIDFLAVEVSGDSGIYITNETPILEVALALLRPILGFLYFTRDGIATVGKFENLTESSIVSLSLTSSDIFPQGDPESDVSAAGDILSIQQVDRLISKAVLLYDRNWTVFSEAQMGAATPIDPNTSAGQIRRDWLKKEALQVQVELTGATEGRNLYETAEDMEPIDSYFINETDAQEAAQYWLTVFGIARFVISVRSAALAYNASLHNVVELDYSILNESDGGRRNRWFTERLTRSVAYEENYGDNVINMLLFI